MQPTRKIDDFAFPPTTLQQPVSKKRRDPFEGISPDWKRTILQTKCDKSLILNGLQFCQSWTLVEAIRDLMQNAIDSMLKNHRRHHPGCHCSITVQSPLSGWDGSKKMIQKFYVLSPDGALHEERGFLSWDPEDTEKGPIFTIVNREASFGPAALSIGFSTKALHDAGGHGEGLKAAATVACRQDLQFEIFQSGIAASFSKQSHIVYRVHVATSKKLTFQRKTCELAKAFNVSAKNDVIIHLGQNKALQFQHVKKAADCFLFFTHRPVADLSGAFPAHGFLRLRIYPTASGRTIVIGNGLSGRVYVRDIFFEKKQHGQKKWAVNLLKDDAPNRDRNYIPQDTYASVVGKLVSDCLDGNTILAEEIMQELEEALDDVTTVDHLLGLPKAASPMTKKLFREAFKKQQGNVSYIVPGNRRDRAKDDTLIPRWCDIRACRVVHPVLYELIQEGYPSVEMIKKQCSDKLLGFPLNQTETDVLRKWLRSNAHLLAEGGAFIWTNHLLANCQVFDSVDRLDVPLFIITGHAGDSHQHYPKIVFSNRALQQKADSQFAFLELMREALRSMQSYAERANLQVEIPFQDVTRVSTDRVYHKNQVCSDFDNHLVVQNIAVLDDEKKFVSELINSLQATVMFEKYLIACTKQALTTWDRLVRSNSKQLFFLAKESIRLCCWALDILNPDHKCPLNFYLSQESQVVGFASQAQGVRVNLRSVLLHAESATLPTALQMSSYFSVLIAHEYAHFVNDTDGHSPNHARRTEQYMRLIMQGASLMYPKRLT